MVTDGSCGGFEETFTLHGNYVIVCLAFKLPCIAFLYHTPPGHENVTNHGPFCLLYSLLVL